MRPSVNSLAVLLAAALVASPALTPPALAAGYEDPVDLTFPTEEGVTYTDDFDSPRSGGRRHKSTDLMGEKLTEVYAAVGGTVTYIPGAAEGESEPGYGYMITVEGDDGREYGYVHLNNDTPGTDDGRGGAEWAFAPGLEEGSRVERGQWIGYMGDSGNAEGTGPHLHFSIDDPDVDDPYGSSRRNPYASLVDAEERGDYAVAGQADGAEFRTVGFGTALPARRLAGPDRVGTAVALSAEVFDAAEHVVIAPSHSFPEAVVAGPLAAAVGGPVLTTRADRLDGRVADELERLGAERVTLVGDTATLSDRVERDLVRAGLAVERLAGDDRAATAVAVAGRVWELADADAGERRALVALGSHPRPERAWPDALAAGWHGAVSASPVLLVDPDAAPAATLAALDGVADATIVGGEAAVSAAIADAVAERVPTVHRLAGQDRFATAVAVAEDLAGRADPPGQDVLWVATGSSYADALTAAPAVARLGETFLLIDGTGQGADALGDRWLADRAGAVGAVRVLGGDHAVNDDAVAALRLRLTPTTPTVLLGETATAGETATVVAKPRPA